MGTNSPARTPLVEVVVAEELDPPAAARLNALLADALALHPDQLVIDLADCPFIHAVAVNVLLDAHRQVWQAGGRLTLRSPSPRLRRLLKLARVEQVFHITPASHPEPPANHRTTAPHSHSPHGRL